jgi:hypothetical protein
MRLSATFLPSTVRGPGDDAEEQLALAQLSGAGALDALTELCGVPLR